MCEKVNFGDGGLTIVCGLGSHRKRCFFCKNRYQTKLCDFPVGNKKTCDAPMCDLCATSVGHDLDYCPKHKNWPNPIVQAGLFEEGAA